jgi:hypothetical protein
MGRLISLFGLVIGCFIFSKIDVVSCRHAQHPLTIVVVIVDYFIFSQLTTTSPLTTATN